MALESRAATIEVSWSSAQRESVGRGFQDFRRKGGWTLDYKLDGLLKGTAL
jgi:hypothetical protein